jgi:hypothetical protein
VHVDLLIIIGIKRPRPLQMDLVLRVSGLFPEFLISVTRIPQKTQFSHLILGP